MAQQLQDIEAVNQVAKKLGINDVTKMDDKQIKQVAIESNVNETDLRTLINKPKQPTPGPKNPIAATVDTTNQIPGMTNIEVQNLIKNRKKDLEGAKEISSTSKEFQDFKKQLSEVTGENNDNLLNLVAMKAAGKLLSGKTKEKGVRGFLDIGGQTLESAANDMLQLALAQKAQDMELAKAFLKMKADQSQGPGFEAGDKVFKIEDPNFPNNYYNVKGIRGKDGRQYYRDINNQVKPVPPGAVGYETNENQDKINLYSANLEENKRGQQMINEVIKILPEEGPLNAAFNLVKEDIFGTLEQMAGKRILEEGGSFDAEIKALMRKNDGSKEQMKQSDALIKKFDDETKGVKERAVQLYRKAEGGFLSRPTEEQLRKYAKLALIEQRMKYIVANANKSEDRLTQKDIENAEKNTKIIQFIGSAGKVRSNYLELQNEFRKKAEGFARQYRNAGGTESSMQYFKDTVPGIKEMYEMKQRENLKEQVLKDKQTVTNILTTIPVYGGGK